MDILMEIYCVKCKKKTDTEDPVREVTKNGRPMVVGKCAVCGSKKCRFVKE